MGKVLEFPTPEKRGYVRVRSETLVSSGIFPGDIAVVDLTSQPADGELGVIIVLAATAFMFIRYIYREGQDIRLTTKDSCYEDEIFPIENVRLIARVSYVQRARKQA